MSLEDRNITRMVINIIGFAMMRIGRNYLRMQKIGKEFNRRLLRGNKSKIGKSE